MAASYDLTSSNKTQLKFKGYKFEEDIRNPTHTKLSFPSSFRSKFSCRLLFALLFILVISIFSNVLWCNEVTASATVMLCSKLNGTPGVLWCNEVAVNVQNGNGTTGNGTIGNGTNAAPAGNGTNAAPAGNGTNAAPAGNGTNAAPAGNGTNAAPAATIRNQTLNINSGIVTIKTFVVKPIISDPVQRIIISTTEE
jgi:hypothetical protein